VSASTAAIGSRWLIGMSMPMANASNSEKFIVLMQDPCSQTTFFNFAKYRLLP
jgi:hypothetical protein